MLLPGCHRRHLHRFQGSGRLQTRHCCRFRQNSCFGRWQNTGCPKRKVSFCNPEKSQSQTRMFKTLWRLVHGLIHASATLVWTLALLFVLLFTFAVFGMELIQEDMSSCDHLFWESPRKLQEHWGPSGHKIPKSQKASQTPRFPKSALKESKSPLADFVVALLLVSDDANPQDWRAPQDDFLTFWDFGLEGSEWPCSLQGLSQHWTHTPLCHKEWLRKTWGSTYRGLREEQGGREDSLSGGCHPWYRLVLFQVQLESLSLGTLIIISFCFGQKQALRSPKPGTWAPKPELKR